MVVDSIFGVFDKADKRILLFESGAFSINVDWLELKFEWAILRGPPVDLVEELVHLLLISGIILVTKDLRL